MEIVIHLARAIFYFIFIVVIIRFLGKREIGQLGTFDIIFLLIIADISAISIENIDEPVWYYIIVISGLAIAQKIISFIQLKSIRARNIIDGKPSIIVYNGKVNIEEMRKQLYTIDDLIAQLRQKNIRLISEVEIAILETDGNLSAFKKEHSAIPLPIIISGEFVEENLKLMNLSRENIDINPKDVYCAYYYEGKCLKIETFTQ